MLIKHFFLWQKIQWKPNSGLISIIETIIDLCKTSIWYLLNIQSMLDIQSTYKSSLKITENITIQDRHMKFLQHKREIYNTEGSVGNRTRSPTLSSKIEPGILTTRPRKPHKLFLNENKCIHFKSRHNCCQTLKIN